MALGRRRVALAALGGLAAIAVGGTAWAQDGADLYGLCAQCHGPAGGGDEAALAPAIAGLDEWYVAAQLRNFQQGLRGLHPEDVGGLRMYPMSRALKSDANIQAVAAYVARLPRSRPERVLEGGNPQRGAPLYATCTQCHGANGAGNQALNAPSLVGVNDWYLLSSLEKYKAGIRGGNPRNANALIMRGMAMSLADEQAMKDVIAYIMTLGD